MRLLAYALLSGMAAVGAGGIAAAQTTGGPPKTPAAPATPAIPAPQTPVPETPAPDTPAPETLAPATPGNLLTFADPGEVLNIAKGYGAANLEKNEQGDPLISGRLDGVKYSVLFYSCESGANCRSIQFSTGYTDPFSAEKANAWNRDYRWVKAYEVDGASSFRMDVDFQGGITRESLDAQFETWNSFIPTIRDFVAGKS